MPDSTSPTGEPPREQIYRCGWCGLPTDQRGVPVAEDPDAYLAAHAGAKEELVHGECCPNGNEDEQERAASREMAMDAGDLNLEGW